MIPCMSKVLILHVDALKPATQALLSCTVILVPGALRLPRA
jgi:hypothetical protein